MRHCSRDRIRYSGSGALLLRFLQSGYPFGYYETLERLRGILHESFHPTSDASRFPEGRHGWLMHHCLKMVTDGATGERESRSVTLIVKFQVAGGMPIAEGI